MFSACSATSKHRPITAAGSTSVQPFMELLAEEYARLYPDKPVVNVQGGGSSAGVRSVLSGAASMGMLSRKLAPDEESEGLHVVVMAQDAIAVIVNPQNPITDISVDNLRKIYSGEITDWSKVSQLLGTKTFDVDTTNLYLSEPLDSKKSTVGISVDSKADSTGGIPGNSKVEFRGKIHVISREEGSGTRGAFDDMIMGEKEVTPKAIFQDSNGSVKQTVAQDPMAIGYISLGLVDRSLKSLAINGEPPTIENCKSGKYLLVRPFIVVFQGKAESGVQEYLEFITGQHSQKILADEGLITGHTEDSEDAEQTENHENPEDPENTGQQGAER